MRRRQISTRAAFLIPLVIAILVLCLVTVFIGIKNNSIRENKALSEMQQNVLGELKERLSLEAMLLKSDLHLLGSNQKIKQAWLAKDRQLLQQASLPYFKDLKANFNVTHFYFIGLDKKCFLRVHQPESYGDLISRFTLSQAEKGGEFIAGIELGKFGIFTLRAVMPWFIDGKQVGYIGLGKEIEHLAMQIKEDIGVELFFLIKKDLLNFQDWSDGQKSFGKKEDWNLMPDYVIADRTWDDVPDKLMNKLINGSMKIIQLKILYDSGQEHYFDAESVPLVDVSGNQVGVIWIQSCTNI